MTVSAATVRAATIKPATIKAATVGGPCGCCDDGAPYVPPVPADFFFILDTAAEDYEFMDGTNFEFIQP